MIADACDRNVAALELDAEESRDVHVVQAHGVADCAQHGHENVHNHHVNHNHQPGHKASQHSLDMGHAKSTGDHSRNNLASSTSKGNISGAAKLSRGDLHSKGDLHGASLADSSPKTKTKGDHHGKHKPKSVGVHHSRNSTSHHHHSHHENKLLESIKHKQKHEKPLTSEEIEFMSTRVVKGKHFRFKSRP